MAERVGAEEERRDWRMGMRPGEKKKKGKGRVIRRVGESRWNGESDEPGVMLVGRAAVEDLMGDQVRSRLS